MKELKEGIPAITVECAHCRQESLYPLTDVTEFGEAICPQCRGLFWSFKLLDFARSIREAL